MNISSLVAALGRPVAFYPTIARAFGDVNVALIVCQFMYWRSRVGGREIYKTQAEIEAETFVPPHTQRRILKKLSDMGMVTIEKKGIPAKNHFLWHWDVVDAFISDYILQSQHNVPTSANKLSPLDLTNSHDQTRQIVTTITENTTEITTEINKRSQLLAKFAQLWDTWPTGLGEKGSRKNAENVFLKLKPDDELFHTIITSRNSQALSKSQAKALGEFASPFQHVERWLRNRRWEDEIESPQQEQSAIPDYYL